MINACCEEKYEKPEWGLTFNSVRKTAKKISSFISKFKSQGGMVVYIGCSKWAETEVADNIKRLYKKNPDANVYTQVDIDNSTKFYNLPSGPDATFYKNSYSAFSNLELDSFLKRNKINHLYICGFYGEGCVNSTIHGAFALGYDITPIEDLIDTFDKDYNQQLCKMIKSQWEVMFGNVVNCRDFFRVAASE